MSPPRVLIVRSGARAFAPFGATSGMEVVERVSHSIQPLDVPPSAFDRPADLLIWTSQNTVERLLADGGLASRLRDAVAGGRMVAVGRSTAGALRRGGWIPDLVAKGSAESILACLPGRLDGAHVLLPSAEDAAPALSEALARRGAAVTRVAVYRKVPAAADAALGLQILEHPFAAFCVTSPSAAAWLFDGLAPGAAKRLRLTPAVVLGPSTRRSLESHGVARICVAEEARFEAAARLLQKLVSVRTP